MTNPAARPEGRGPAVPEPRMPPTEQGQGFPPTASHFQQPSTTLLPGELYMLKTSALAVWCLPGKSSGGKTLSCCSSPVFHRAHARVHGAMQARAECHRQQQAAAAARPAVHADGADQGAYGGGESCQGQRRARHQSGVHVGTCPAPAGYRGRWETVSPRTTTDQSSKPSLASLAPCVNNALMILTRQR
jgi:hypothetical protein